MKSIWIITCLLSVNALDGLAKERITMDDDEKLIDGIYSKCIEVIDKTSLTPVENMVYRIEHYLQEIGSGEDFIQWFNWTEPADTSITPKILKTIGATNSAAICASAIQVAFPSGITTNKDVYRQRMADVEFEESFTEARKQLSELAQRQLAECSQVTKLLASWVRQNNKTKAQQTSAGDGVKSAAPEK
jgi:hypothetical protein